MGGRNFLTIPIAQCKTEYKKIMQNSDDSWDSAEILADKQKYGHAISMHIISIEELIKGLVVFFDGQGFHLRNIKGIDIFFREHQIRHFIAYGLFAMGVVGDDLIALLERIKANPEKITEWHKKFVEGKVDPAEEHKFYLLRKFVLFKKEFEWFSRIDVLRQEGFYCDLDENIKSPSQISKEDYEEVIKRMKKIKWVAKWFIKSFETTDNSLREQIEKLKSDFQKEGFKEKVSAGLAAMRKSRVGPFKHIRTHFEKHF